MLLGNVHTIEPWLTSDVWRTHGNAHFVQVKCANTEEYIHQCDSNPCVHGQCFGGIDSYYCLCEHNWKGKTCDQKSKNINNFSVIFEEFTWKWICSQYYYQLFYRGI